MARIANPALKDLAVLIGDWDLALSFPVDPPGQVCGHASCAWLEDGAFLLMRTGAKTAGAPYSISIIGRDDSTETYTLLYLDDRSVSRVYQMSLGNGEWKQWREAPGFSQRFTGRFSAASNTITARWEKSTDGVSWEHDFDLTYTRVNGEQQPVAE